MYKGIKYKRHCRNCSISFITHKPNKLNCSEYCQRKSWRNNPIYKRLCRNCLNEFNTHKPNKVSCSSKCQKDSYYIMNKDRLNKHINKLHICLECTQQFIPKHFPVRRKFCSARCLGRFNRRKYYHNNRDKNLLQLKNYRSSQKGKLKRTFLQLKRQRKIKTLQEIFTVEDWNSKLVSTFGVCPHCNNYVGIKRMTKDHIIPITKAPTGYEYTINDVQPLCRSCNSSKHDKYDGALK